MTVSHLCQWHQHGLAPVGVAGHPVHMLARRHTMAADASGGLTIDLAWSGDYRIGCSVAPLERHADGSLTVRIRLELSHTSGGGERRCEETDTVLQPGARLPFMQILLLQGMDQAVHSGVIEYA